MNRHTALVPLIVLTAASLARAEIYVSPDKQVEVEVMSAGPGHEHRLEVRDAQHRPITAADYSSGDGEHGQIVHRGEWSADSAFFIFSAENAGGHQSWQSSIYFFNRADKKICPFTKYLPPVAERDFKLVPPDLVTISVWTPFTHGIDGSIILPITFSMHELIRAESEAQKRTW